MKKYEFIAELKNFTIRVDVTAVILLFDIAPTIVVLGEVGMLHECEGTLAYQIKSLSKEFCDLIVSSLKKLFVSTKKF